MKFKCLSLKLGCIQIFTSFQVLIPILTPAQIVPDATLPVTSVIENGENNTKIINGGTTGGSNLFHSFEQFTIPTGGSAYFNNATDIQNIFSRVTGNSISNIDGILRANGNASLFLLNHNGIIFGPNASLNIGGSFLATTASQINFDDGTQFSTKPSPTTPLLTMSVPVGLNLDSSSGKIYVQGSGHSLIGTIFRPVIGTNQPVGLRVQPGNNIFLVGRDVVLEGGIITAPSGRIEIGSVDNGTVNLNLSNPGWTLDYPEVSDFKDIELSTRALIDASGFGNGSIQLQGNNIGLADGSVIILQNQGLLPSGGIALNAMNSIQVSGTDPIARIPGSVRTETLTSGKSGDIVVSAPKLIVTEGGAIITATYSNGEAGNIILKAPNSIQVNGTSPRLSVAASNISSLAFSAGAAGDISVQTGNFLAVDGGLLLSTTGGSGAGGDIQIDATKSIELLGVQPNTLAPSSISAATFNTGNAGSVTLNTSRLLIENGGRVDSSTLASGTAGSITVNALDSVEVKGTVLNSRNPSLIISSGNILDETLQTSFGQVDESTLTGASGDVTINTRRLTVTDGGLISVNNEGFGNAGTLEIFADSIYLDNKGAISAATTSGQGGTIFVQAEQLRLNNSSSLTATANGGRGSGGNITINTDTLVALKNSDITARAFEGNGGNIYISTQGLFSSPDSEINASSGFGVDGIVQTQVLGFDVSNSLTPLKNNLVTPEQVIKGSCLARRNAQQGSFVVTGSGGLPINPYSGTETWDEPPENTTYQSSSSLNNSNQIEVTPKKWQPGDPIVEAQTLIVTADGRGLLRTKQQTEIANSESLVCRTEPVSK